MHFGKIKTLFPSKFLGLLFVFCLLVAGLSVGSLLLSSHQANASGPVLDQEQDAEVPSGVSLSYDSKGNIVMTYNPPGQATPVTLTFNYSTQVAEEGGLDPSNTNGYLLPNGCDSNCQSIFEYLSNNAQSSVQSFEGLQIYGNQGSSPVRLDVYYERGQGRGGNQYNINFSATVAHANTNLGAAHWINGNDKDEAPNLQFISPTAIYDTNSGVYYVTDGNGLYSNGGAQFLKDGDTLYWPSNGVQHGSTCYGGLNVETASGHSVYLKVFTVPTTYDNGNKTCEFGPQGNTFEVSDSSPTFANTNTGTDSTTGIVSTGTDNVGVHLDPNDEGGNDPITNIVEGQSGSNSTDVKLPSVPKDMEFATLQWEDNNTIQPLGNGTQLTAVSSGDLKSIEGDITLPSDDGSSGTWQAFTSNACEPTQSKVTWYTFLLVHYDNSASTIANTDFGSQNAIAYIYSANTDSSGWQDSSWSQSNANCLFGGNAPSSNQTVENSDGSPSANSSRTYITDLNQSLSTSLPASLTPPATQTLTPGAPPQPTCEASDFSLAWLVCSAVNAIADIETSIEHTVEGLLQTPPLVYSGNACTSSAPDNISSSQSSSYLQACTYKVWSNFRVYADILLVIALLVAVFAEAAGGGLIEAYTVKKMLPRILLTAVLINLSIYIVGGLMDVTNILAAGMFNIILEPFRSAIGNAGWSINLNSLPFVNFPGGSLLGVLALGGGIWGAFAGGAGAVAGAVGDALVGAAFVVGLPVLMAVIGVLVTITIRIIMIYFLIMIAPVAFALYVLPNTEQYFRKWWKYLVQTLMVYPIIVMVFALTDVGAVILNKATYNGNGLWRAAKVTNGIDDLLGIVAVAAPLFLIPFAFKISGGAMASVYEGVTNARNKIHQTIKGDERDPGSLGNRMKRRLASGRSQLGLSGAQIGQRLDVTQLRHGRAGRRERIAARREGELVKIGGQSLESDAIVQRNKTNEKFLLAHTNRKQAEENMKNATGGEKAAWQQAIAASDLVPRTAAAKAQTAQMWAATGYGISDGHRGYTEMAETMADVSGLKRSDLIYETKTDAKGTYQAVVGVKSGAKNEGIYRENIQNGQFAAKNAGLTHLGGLNNGDGYDPEMGLSKTDPYTLLTRSKPADILAKSDLVRSHAEDAMAAHAEGDTAEYDSKMQKAWVHRQELKNALGSNETGANRDVIAAQLAELDGNVDLNNWAQTGTGGTVRERVAYPSGGFRDVDRAQTNADVARPLARGARVPNPSELDTP